jgi:hypothetical protein
MSGAAHNLDQEFWRPPEHSHASQDGTLAAEVCPRCSSEFVIGSRFCHVCGAEREPQPEINSPGLSRYLNFHFIRDSVGLSIGSLIAFIAGLGCVAAAIATGLLYTASTVLDWQAVQVWRMEWLMAAAAAFLAGILLKRHN